MGDGQYSKMSVSDLINKAREKYHVYHILIRETHAGSRSVTIDSWKQLLGDHVLVAQNHSDVSDIIAETIKKTFGVKSVEVSKTKKQDVIL